MLKNILLSMLLLQATATMAQECSEEEIVTEKITDASQAIGNWSVVYVWNKEVALSSMGRSLCVKTSLTSVTADQIAAQKEKCKHSRVPFDYDSVVMKIAIPHFPLLDRLVSHDGENAFIQQSCYLVTKVEARRVSDNYLMLAYTDTNIAELLSKTVPEKADLSCTVRNIDVMKNRIGFPLCFN